MKIIIKTIAILISSFIIMSVIMFVFNICPPAGPWPMPPWCDKNSFISPDSSSKLLPISQLLPFSQNIDLFVTVPYWTEGEVFLGIGDDPQAVALERINEVSYRASNVSLKQGTVYYYSRGTEDTREVAPIRTLTTGGYIRDAVTNWQDAEKSLRRPGFHKGVTFGGMHWPEENMELVDRNILILKEFGVDHIALVPNWFIFPNYRGSEIKPFYRDDGPFPNPTNWISPTLTDEEVKSIISRMHEAGISVILKPHVDPIDFGMPGHKSRGACHPEDWDEWFSNYTTFIVHYAKIAEEMGVSMLVIGTELDTATMEVLDNYGAPSDATMRWRKIIAEVRNHYSGPLTYSVACGDDGFGPQNINFWDALDYIGFEPYFGLTDKNDPSIDEMKAAFDKAFDRFAKPLYQKYKKPVILTEANIFSFDGANRDPIGSNIQKIASDATSIMSLPIDHQEQADFYETLFQSVVEREWIVGVYWWGWYLNSTTEEAENWQAEDRFDPFVRKPAGQVLKKWYNSL